MSDRLSLEDLLSLFGQRGDSSLTLAFADSQENLRLALYLVGRSRYLV